MAQTIAPDVMPIIVPNIVRTKIARARIKAAIASEVHVSEIPDDEFQLEPLQGFAYKLMNLMSPTPLTSDLNKKLVLVNEAARFATKLLVASSNEIY